MYRNVGGYIGFRRVWSLELRVSREVQNRGLTTARQTLLAQILLRCEVPPKLTLLSVTPLYMESTEIRR